MAIGLKRGEVARKAGGNIVTLRFYERQGALSPPPRLDSGYRAYPPETVDIVIFIKRAQELGFTLKEIQSLLALAAAKGTPGVAVVTTGATARSPVVVVWHADGTDIVRVAGASGARVEIIAEDPAPSPSQRAGQR